MKNNIMSGMFLIIGDLVREIEFSKFRKLLGIIKHQILIQSWWRALIIFMIVGLIGVHFPVTITGFSLIICFIILNYFQYKYALKKGTWDNVFKNDHLFLPFVFSIIFLTSLYVLSIKQSIPHYDMIRKIQLNDKTVTDNSVVFLNIDGGLVELDTGSNCVENSLVQVYKETKYNNYINLDFTGKYYLDCHRPIKKILKITKIKG